MIIEELKKIIIEERDKGADPLFIRNALKEYLQVYALYFIYTSASYQKNLIFTGGTCLRHFFDLERLSEDVDFDYLQEFNVEQLKNDLLDFFKKKYQYERVEISLKNRKRQILLKFPVLKELGLSQQHESDVLHVKMDIEKNPSDSYSLQTTSKSKYGFNFAAKHFDLPSLMSGKIHAVLMRDYYTSQGNRPTIKGRDYFDLLWFLKKGIIPNMQRLSEILDKKMTVPELEKRLDEKVILCTTKFKNDFQSDLFSLVRNPDVVRDFTDHYGEEYLRHKAKSFADIVNLEVTCAFCKKRFSSGIQIPRSVFESLGLQNVHVCPFCKKTNRVNKKDYIPIKT